jgi:hypothetical protein
MFSADDLIPSFARNLSLIRTFTDGFDRADALRPPPFRSNCALWIVGHIAVYRSVLCELHLDQPPTVDAATVARFKKDSAPVLGEEPGLPQLAELLASLDVAQARIAAALPILDAARAHELVEYGAFPDPRRRSEVIVHLMRHEAYHTGQLELLAEMVRGGR